MNCNHSRASPSSVSGARKGPKDDQPVLPSINTAFLPPSGIVGLPEVPSPRSGGASYYKKSNPDSVTAKSFNFNHESETPSSRSCNENMDNIDDDLKPFVPPISPDILQTSTKDDKDRLIKWELTGDTKLTGGETYRTDEETQPRPSDIPDVSREVHRKLRKSVSFDIPKEPSAPPLSPEPPTQPPVTGKPPVSPRRTHSLPIEGEGTSMSSSNTGPSPPASPPAASNETQFDFGRMRFKQVNVSIVSANDNVEERVPSPPSAPKPANHNVAMDEQNNGKVRRQWQRESADLVIVTQNDSVSPRADAVTAQSSTYQQNLVNTTDSTLQQAQAKNLLMQQEILHLRQQIQAQQPMMNSEFDQNPFSTEEKKDANPSEAENENSHNGSEVDLTSNPKEQYLRDMHDIFSSCDKIEEKLVQIEPEEREEAEESEDLSTIKETASKIVGNVIARAISEEDRRKKSDDIPADIFDVMNETSPETEFLERQETPTTVPDTDEDAAAKAEILNLEISNGVNRFISSSSLLDQEPSRSNSQASSQPAEVPAEELSEASHDDLDERLKLIRQDSFVEEGGAVSDPSAQELEDKLKNIRNSFERKLSSSKEEVENEAAKQSEAVSITAYQELYPSDEFQRRKDVAEAEERRAHMLTRSDSGITEGSQALNHITDTLKLQLIRQEMRGADDETFIASTEKECVNDGRQSASSMAGSEASSVKSGPISQPLSTDAQYSTSDWSCRRCFGVNFATRPTCQQCGLPRQARSQDENETNKDEIERLKSSLQSYTEKEKFWSEEIEKQKSKVKELNKIVEQKMQQQQMNESRREDNNEMLQTELEQLRAKCVAEDRKKEELCEMFEERLKELQGQVESQTLKNTELTQLYNEITDKYEGSESSFKRMKSERDQLFVGMRGLESTIETLNKGHSAELERLRQKLEENQNAYSSLGKMHSTLKDEKDSMSRQLGSLIQQEEATESSKEELEKVKIELDEAKSEVGSLEQMVTSLKEEKQEKDKLFKEKMLRKKSEVNDLKEAVKKYVSEFDKLQQELSEERQMRSEIEQKVVILESLKSEMEEERQLKTSNSEDIELLRRLLDEESAKCLRLGAEMKSIDDRLKDYDILRENLETEKLNTQRLETTIGALTDNEETIVLRKALGEAQVKIQNFEQTVELLKENNKVIDELRRELEEEKSRPKSARSYGGSPRGKNEELDDLRRDLLIEKAKRSELEQSYHSLQGSLDVQGLREVQEMERARSGRLEKQFSVQLDELRLDGTAAALRGAGQDIPTLLAAEKLKVIELEKTLDNLKAELSQARNKLRHQRVANQSSPEKQHGTENHFEELEDNNRRMLERIRVLEESKAELMEKVRAENNTIYHKYDTTIEDYRQQLRQIKDTHTTAITRLESEISEYQKRIEQDAAAICTLEERLNNVVKRNREHEAENASLTHQNSEMRSRLQSDIPALTTHAMTPIPRPESGKQCHRTRADKDVPQNFVAMEQLVVRLRREIANMKNQVTRSKTTNAEQQKELNAATLKITHLTGELNEIQRRRTDQRRERRKEHENEIKLTQDQLCTANSTLEQQMREIRDLKASVTKYKQAATKLKTLGKEKDSQIQELKTTVSRFTKNDVRETVIQPLPDVTPVDDKSYCGAHRHREIIENQKEALLELRAKVKVFEQQTSSEKGLRGGDTSAELATVKRELSELRAKEMLRSQVKESPRSARKSKSAEHNISDVRLSMESSGNSYLSLVKALEESLDLKNLPDVADDQIQLITNRIKLLKDRIRRKEELLSGYESDLSKLRIAEEKVMEKDQQIVALKNEMKDRIEESEYLKEALNRTRESLECEQRLHGATKTRKAHQMVNSTQNPTIMNGHVPHRPTSATRATRPRSATRPSSAKKAVSDSKESAKKKANVDRMKKKDFEIEVLKTELQYTTTDLVHAKRQIERLSGPLKTIDQENGEVAEKEAPNSEM